VWWARKGAVLVPSQLGMLVDNEIDLSTRKGNVRVFINSRYHNVMNSGAYQQDL
jgi:hypothetical protein